MSGRGLRGRRLARLELAIAIGVIGFVALLFLAAPPMIGPLYRPDPWWAGLIVAVAGLAIGLAWMARIYRSIQDAEAHESSFRSSH
jgi:hypothetical protein